MAASAKLCCNAKSAQIEIRDALVTHGLDKIGDLFGWGPFGHSSHGGGGRLLSCRLLQSITSDFREYPSATDYLMTVSMRQDVVADI
jgi:hypothetical protein